MAGTRNSRHEAAPVRITTAPVSHHDDVVQRRRRYAMSMAVRTLCFIGAIVVPITWLRIVFMVGALVLPYVAVVMANSASPRVPGTDLMSSPGGHKELG